MMHDRENLKSAIEWMEKAPPATWVREMRDHYRRTGTYRASDIRRVMGDQTEGVKVESDPSRVTHALAR